MIPAFHCDQTEEEVKVIIHADESKFTSSCCSLDETGRIFSFSAHPYHLRLVFPFAVSCTDGSNAQLSVERVIPEDGQAGEERTAFLTTVHLKKVHPGQFFPGLDTLHPLLKTPSTVRTLKDDEPADDGECTCGGKERRAVQGPCYALGPFGDINPEVAFAHLAHTTECPQRMTIDSLGEALNIQPFMEAADVAEETIGEEMGGFDITHCAVDTYDEDGTTRAAFSLPLPTSFAPRQRDAPCPPLRPQDATTLAGVAADVMDVVCNAEGNGSEKGGKAKPQSAGPTEPSARLGADVSASEGSGGSPKRRPRQARLLTADEVEKVALSLLEVVAAVAYEWRCVAAAPQPSEAVDYGGVGEEREVERPDADMLDEPSPEASYHMLRIPLTIARLLPPPSAEALVTRFVRRVLCFGMIRSRVLALRCIADAAAAVAAALPREEPSSSPKSRTWEADIRVFATPTRVPLLTALAFLRRVLTTGGTATGRTGGLVAVATHVVDPLIQYVVSPTFPTDLGPRSTEAKHVRALLQDVRRHAMRLTGPSAPLDALIGLPLSQVEDVAAAMREDGPQSGW